MNLAACISRVAQNLPLDFGPVDADLGASLDPDRQRSRGDHKFPLQPFPNSALLLISIMAKTDDAEVAQTGAQHMYGSAQSPQSRAPGPSYENRKNTASSSSSLSSILTAWSQARTVLPDLWLFRLALLAVPAGFAVKYANSNPVVTFIVNFVAILPLANVLTTVTQELSRRTGRHKALVIIVSSM
ncbi:MAG: hypothetical protein Q9190_007948 [Brigantiaea leucoxantha]